MKWLCLCFSYIIQKKTPTYLRKTKNMDRFNNFIPVLPFGLSYLGGKKKKIGTLFALFVCGQEHNIQPPVFSLPLCESLSPLLLSWALCLATPIVSPLLFAQVESRKYWGFHFHFKYWATVLRKCFYKACQSHWSNASQNAALQTAAVIPSQIFYHH